MDSLTLSTSLSPHYSSLNLRHGSFPKLSPACSPYPSLIKPLSIKSSLAPQKPSSKTGSGSGMFFPDFHMGPQTPARAMSGAEADVMGLLLKERIVFLASDIDDFVADAIMSQLLLLDAQDSTKDIRLFINCSGGSLSATMAIFDVVQLVRADVSTVALGISAYTASIILGGGTKGKRFAMPNGRIMIHQPLGGASGNVIDVDIQARELIKNKENVINILSSCTGRSYEQVEKDIDRERYMSPIEAVEYGLIDGVIDRDSIIPLAPVPERVKAFVDPIKIKEDFDKFFNPDIPDDEIY